MNERRTFQFLNVMRFISAVWAALFHMAASPLNKAIFSPKIDWMRKWLILPFSGLAAVMVFFVISGFCIHFPYATGKPLRLPPFYLQRFTRIGLPLLAAAGIHAWAGTLHWLKTCSEQSIARSSTMLSTHFSGS